MNIEHNESTSRVYLGGKYYYKFSDGVIKLDYYKDHLALQLPGVMQGLISRRNSLRILDMATGHGYTLAIVTKHYADRISKVVAYDINPTAVELAKFNLELNRCSTDKIEFRVGSLYEPLNKDEKFDLIISALPPVPIESQELESLPNDVKVHHWVTSTAGKTGRNLLDGMLVDAHRHLFEHGIVLTAQADFQNAISQTIDVMKRNHLIGQRLGTPLAIKLKNTKLSLARRENIIANGYKFTLDRDGDEQFFIETYNGEYCNG